MKKLALVIIASLAYLQTAQAATTALVESLLEYNAITAYIGAPGFTTIGPAEFIIGIDRITRSVDVVPGIARYRICTRIVTAGMDEDGLETEGRVYHEYIATLSITPNPGIGPNIVTVLSIVAAR
jgi:hypothetical protein